MKFYKNLGTTLLLFNFLSIFFLILTIFAYALIQYMFVPLVSIAQMLFSDEASRNILYNILNIALSLPQYLDYCFLLIVIVFSINIFYMAFKSPKSNIYYTLMFSLLGLPVYIYFLNIMNTLKIWALGFLQSAITYNINMTFFNFIVNNSIVFTIFVFMIAIFIRSVDWDNINIFNANKESGFSSEEKTLNNILEQ